MCPGPKSPPDCMRTVRVYWCWGSARAASPFSCSPSSCLSRRKTKMPSRRSLLALIVVLPLIAVSSAAGEVIDGYTAAGTPAHMKPSTSKPFTIALTNKASSPKPADRAKIGIPAGFVVAPGTVQASASAAGTCVASTWVADGTLIADGKINLKRPGGGGGASSLCAGGTLTVMFSATSPAEEGTYGWATALLRDTDTFLLTGPQPGVRVDGTAPIVTIDPAPQAVSSDPSPTFTFSANEAATLECKLDGGAFALCSSPKSYAPGDGLHTFTLKATDAAGNIGQATYSWRIDTVAPTIEITQSPADRTNVTSATFKFSASETASFQCKLDDGAFAACASPQVYSGLGDASHTFIVRATDEAGNTDQATDTWVIDTVAPTTTITGKPNHPSGVDSAVFQFSASEPATFQCKLDGAPFGVCASPKSYTVLADAVHTFAVRATDAAGNTSQEVTYSWLVETDLPVVTLTATPPNNSSAATFFFQANNATFQCKLDDGPFAACNSPQSYGGLPDGPHTFAVRGTGTAGTGPATIYAWTIDTTGPTTAINDRPAEPTNSRSATFAFSANEAATFQCKLDDGAFASCASPQTYSNLGDGRHTFVARASDALANTGPDAAYAWTIDTRAPTLAITSGAAGLVNNRTTSFSFSADKPATFQCNLDGRGFESCSSPASYAGLRDGDHNFAVRAIDAAGNIAAASRAWAIDATAPQTTIGSRPKAKTAARVATFAFAANEPGAFQCRLDTGSFAPCTSPKTYVRLRSGAHRFMVRAVDAAGNADTTPAVSQWTIGAAVTRSAAGTSALFAPAAGARLSRAPLLRWRAARRATYYNVQLYRAGRKVLTAWPNRTRLQLRMRWRFSGRAERLQPGVYRWYVWPGYGPATQRRYGRLLGTSTFVIRVTR